MKISDFFFGKIVDRRIAAYQNDLITKHVFEVENIYSQMRGWRHDYHNHIQMMLALLDAKKTADKEDLRLKKYLFELNDDLIQIDTVFKTGNVMIDAILNSKISLALAKNIAVNAKATVPLAMAPQGIRLLELDLCVIIGNLLDNAIEACQREQDKNERFIRIYIGILKEQLYISVSNSTCGEVKKNGKAYSRQRTRKATALGLSAWIKS